MFRKKIFLFHFFLSTFMHVYTESKMHTVAYYNAHERMGFFKKIYHGIVPEKIDTLCTLLMAGSIISPAIICGNVNAIKTFIKNNYSADFKLLNKGDTTIIREIYTASSLIIGGALISASILGYLLYNFLHNKTESGILEYKAVLQDQIDLLQTNSTLNEKDVLWALKLIFATNGKDEDMLPLKIRYLKKLIHDIETINKKLLLLNQPLFDQQIISSLRLVLSNLWIHDTTALWMTSGKNAGYWLLKNSIKNALFSGMFAFFMNSLG